MKEYEKYGRLTVARHIAQMQCPCSEFQMAFAQQWKHLAEHDAAQRRRDRLKPHIRNRPERIRYLEWYPK